MQATRSPDTETHFPGNCCQKRFGPTPFLPPPIPPLWQSHTAPCSSFARTPWILALMPLSGKFISQTIEFEPCVSGSPIPNAFQYRFSIFLDPDQISTEGCHATSSSAPPPWKPTLTVAIVAPVRRRSSNAACAAET